MLSSEVERVSGRPRKKTTRGVGRPRRSSDRAVRDAVHRVEGRNDRRSVHKGFIAEAFAQRGSSLVCGEEIAARHGFGERNQNVIVRDTGRCRGRSLSGIDDRISRTHDSP